MHIKSTILKSYRKLVAHPNPWVRRLVGVSLVIGGILGPVLPILGLWMLPMGVIVLIIDAPSLRPMRRRYNAWWRKKLARFSSAAPKSGKQPPDPAPRG